MSKKRQLLLVSFTFLSYPDSILVICNGEIISYDSAQVKIMDTESIEQIAVYDHGEKFEELQKKYNAADKTQILVLTVKK